MSFTSKTKARPSTRTPKGRVEIRGNSSKAKASSKKEWMSDMIEDKRPCFFRIIEGNKSRKEMIPEEFLKHISKELSPKATLTVVTGGSWTVKVIVTKSGDVYMQDGWQEFVRDNSLGDNEFLLFRYDGNMCFSVQIFDENSCERIEAPKTRKHRESAGFSNGKRPRVRSKKNPVDTLNLHHPPFNSSEDGPAGQGLHVTNKKKRKAVGKGNNVNRLSQDRIQKSSKVRRKVKYNSGE